LSSSLGGLIKKKQKQTVFVGWLVCFGGNGVLNSGLHACKADAEPHHQSVLLSILEMGGLANYLPGLVSNCDSSDLSLLSS
jgi:hypothetical protein